LRSLFDLLLCALCLWAAWYHTPPGALARTALLRLAGSRASVPPLLSYYGAGARTAQPIPDALPPPVPLSPRAALGLGASAVLGRMPAAERDEVLARAAISSATAELVGGWIDIATVRYGSREAAVLALFSGDEAARFAVRHARSGATLEQLARELPPRYTDRVALAATTLTLATAYALAWPLPESAQVSSPFGVRAHPLLRKRRLHTGIDFGIPSGTAVRAAGDGIVRRASDDAVSGKLLLLDHGSGVSTLYCHNELLLVSVGDRVSAGQVIARSGNTGLSTGPHLHYQVDLPQGPVDPLRFRAMRTMHVALGGTEP
ncbi:MAG TPA: M23 family metallopeptidase, partial [Myxococcales bacterium]|nr:M23 family metallopeptidase [Myxococcales bacterium]